MTGYGPLWAARDHLADAGIPAEGAERSSLALEHALAPIGPTGGSVLDLGSAFGSNVSFFASRSCKVFIADLNNSLFVATNLAARAEALDEALNRDIPGSEEFDLILVWDLLNYLDTAEIRILGTRLATVCHESTLLYGLISIRKEIPDRPGRYEIRDAKTIVYSVDTRLQRPSPLHKEPELARLMPDFEVESTYLLRHGMMEYLFRRGAG